MPRLVAVLAVAFALVCSGAPAQVQAQAPEKRVALVIGNATYKEQPLKNPANDARLMAARLQELGFDVVARENATRAAMGAAVGEFTRKLGPGTVALIYYAGHGIQSRGRNYLIPVDAALSFESDLRFQAVDVSALTEELEQAQTRVSLVILDACRNNPFEKRMRGGSRGLVAVDAARGGLIAYATAPGSVAADGEGANGPYTEELVKALSVPNLKAEEVFKRVTAAVEQRTNGQQTPWISSSLRGDFIFNLTVNVLPPPASGAASGPADREALFWQSAQASNRIEEYREYLKQFPQGMFAGLARSRIAGLQAAAKPPQAAAAPKPPQAAAAPARPAPVLDPIDRQYVARESARVRETPDLGAKVVATLKEGEAAQVLGKVKDQNWYQVERAGAPPGFVAMAVMEEAASYKKRKAEEERQQRAFVPPPAPAPPPPAPAVAPVPVRNLEGMYNATGTNPNGTGYSGTVTITRSGGNYSFFWRVGNTYRGTGGFQGDKLVIDWGERYPVIYTVTADGRLVGTWNNGNATEVLTKIK